jgi:HPt (histidine-containing phosphotransfer) domain-containing protein
VLYVTRTEQQQFSNVQPLSPDQEFEEVRQSFLARLPSEQANLAMLAKTLEFTVLDSAPAFGDLARFAHRLRGAAAVFEFPTLRDAAKALELAAAVAEGEHAPNSEPLVQTVLRALDIRLASLVEGALSLNAEVAGAPAN